MADALQCVYQLYGEIQLTAKYERGHGRAAFICGSLKGRAVMNDSRLASVRRSTFLAGILFATVGLACTEEESPHAAAQGTELTNQPAPAAALVAAPADVTLTGSRDTS